MVIKGVERTGGGGEKKDEAVGACRGATGWMAIPILAPGLAWPELRRLPVREAGTIAGR